MSGLNKAAFDHRKFRADVYDIVKTIPEGFVLTYGLVARLAGFPSNARMVGKALSNVPPGMNLPCHRVVNSQGRTASNWPEQRTLLENEGIGLKSNGCVPLKQYLWKLF